MPFAATDPVLERARLVALHQDGLYSFSELAERFGVSRPTVYTLFNSQALGHEWIGFEAVADAVWSVYFFDRLLARLDSLPRSPGSGTSSCTDEPRPSGA